MALLTADLSDDFFLDLAAVADRLGAVPLDLLRVMKSESDVRATAHNPNGHASGLIQFMPATLTNLGWTQGHEAFRGLSAADQLPFVEKYFVPFKASGLTSASRLYQATFLPATLSLGSDPDTVICQKGGLHDFAYEPNKVFDANRDGSITVGELQAAIDRNCRGARWDEIVARLNGEEEVVPAFALTAVAGYQGALAALGFLDADQVDGIAGPKTAAAVKAFQESAGLTPATALSGRRPAPPWRRRWTRPDSVTHREFSGCALLDVSVPSQPRRGRASKVIVCSQLENSEESEEDVM